MCCRHLYIPIIEMGYGKHTASITVFFISAFFHEYLVSVPLKTFKIWAFMGMMGQVRRTLLIYVTCISANIDCNIRKFLLKDRATSATVSITFRIVQDHNLDNLGKKLH